MHILCVRVFHIGQSPRVFLFLFVWHLACMLASFLNKSDTFPHVRPLWTSTSFLICSLLYFLSRSVHICVSFHHYTVYIGGTQIIPDTHI